MVVGPPLSSSLSEDEDEESESEAANHLDIFNQLKKRINRFKTTNKLRQNGGRQEL